MPDGPTLSHDVAPIGTASVLNLPNVITFGRLCAVPLAFWMILDRRIDQAFILFLVAGASDALDGWLARRYGGNAIGALMDPVADKALLVTMYITLAAVNILPNWLAILVVFRDVVIVGGVIILSVMGNAVTIRPLYISKVNTLLQIMLVAASLLQGGYGVGLPWLTTALIWSVALTTLASGAAYVWNTARGADPKGTDPKGADPKGTDRTGLIAGRLIAWQPTSRR